MDEFLVSSDTGIAYSATHKVAVSMQPDAAAPATHGKLAGSTGGGDTIKAANWGDDNDFPGMIKKLLGKDAEMTKLIDWCVRAAMGKGVVAMNEVDVDAEGNPVYAGIKDLDIRKFLRAPQTRKYFLEGFIDLFTFFNVYPEIIPTKDRNSIYSLSVNEAMHCRWAEMGDDGRLTKVIHNRNWPGAKLADPKETTIIPALDPYEYNLVEKIKADKSFKKFIYPVSYPTIGQTYYQLAHWDGLRVSGWLDIAAKIPEFKAALLKNQMSIKYLIRIPNTYWPSKYQGWEDMKEPERKKKKQETLDSINASLTDAKNAGKSILNEVGFDPITKEKLPGWDIEVIDDKTKAGAFLEDSQEASAHKMRALGIDPTLIGSLLSKGMSAGSGSDKRLAWNLYMASIGVYRDIMLDPLYFIAEWNGWTDRYEGFTFCFRDVKMETLDLNHKTAQEGVSNAA